jgi:hypothetical protein
VIWARPPGLWPFCAVISVGASVRTHCGGRWSPSEEDELRWTPAAGQRCEACWVAVGRLRQDVATLERLRADLAAPVEADPLEAAKERLRAGPFKAKYAEDVERAKERGAVEMERFEAGLVAADGNSGQER